jgi:hypothetical protein
MFAGAFVGAHYATKLNEVWLRRIFVATVFILAIKMLFDFRSQEFRKTLSATREIFVFAITVLSPTATNIKAEG